MNNFRMAVVFLNAQISALQREERIVFLMKMMDYFLLFYTLQEHSI